MNLKELEQHKKTLVDQASMDEIDRRINLRREQDSYAIELEDQYNLALVKLLLDEVLCCLEQQIAKEKKYWWGKTRGLESSVKEYRAKLIGSSQAANDELSGVLKQSLALLGRLKDGAFSTTFKTISAIATGAFEGFGNPISAGVIQASGSQVPDEDVQPIARRYQSLQQAAKIEDLKLIKLLTPQSNNVGSRQNSQEQLQPLATGHDDVQPEAPKNPQDFIKDVLAAIVSAYTGKERFKNLPSSELDQKTVLLQAKTRRSLWERAFGGGQYQAIKKIVAIAENLARTDEDIATALFLINSLPTSNTRDFTALKEKFTHLREEKANSIVQNAFLPSQQRKELDEKVARAAEERRVAEERRSAAARQVTLASGQSAMFAQNPPSRFPVKGGGVQIECDVEKECRAYKEKNTIGKDNRPVNLSTITQTIADDIIAPGIFSTIKGPLVNVKKNGVATDNRIEVLRALLVWYVLNGSDSERMKRSGQQDLISECGRLIKKIESYPDTLPSLDSLINMYSVVSGSGKKLIEQVKALFPMDKIESNIAYIAEMRECAKKANTVNGECVSDSYKTFSTLLMQNIPRYPDADSYVLAALTLCQWYEATPEGRGVNEEWPIFNARLQTLKCIALDQDKITLKTAGFHEVPSEKMPGLLKILFEQISRLATMTAPVLKTASSSVSLIELGQEESTPGTGPRSESTSSTKSASPPSSVASLTERAVTQNQQPSPTVCNSSATVEPVRSASVGDGQSAQKNILFFRSDSASKMSALPRVHPKTGLPISEYGLRAYYEGEAVNKQFEEEKKQVTSPSRPPKKFKPLEQQQVEMHVKAIFGEPAKVDYTTLYATNYAKALKDHSPELILLCVLSNYANHYEKQEIMSNGCGRAKAALHTFLTNPNEENNVLRLNKIETNNPQLAASEAALNVVMKQLVPHAIIETPFASVVTQAIIAEQGDEPSELDHLNERELSCSM